MPGTELLGSASRDFAENSMKRLPGIEAGFFGYYLKLLGGGEEQLHCVSYTVFIHEFEECLAVIVVEEPAHICSVGIGKGRYIGEFEMRIEENLFFLKKDTYQFLKMVDVFIRIIFAGVIGRNGFGKFIDYGFVPIDEIADEHPDNERSQEVDRFDVEIDHEAVSDPEGKDHEEGEENVTQPVKVDVLVVRESLFEKAVVTGNCEDGPYGVTESIDRRPRHIGVIERDVTGGDK